MVSIAPVVSGLQINPVLLKEMVAMPAPVWQRLMTSYMSMMHDYGILFTGILVEQRLTPIFQRNCSNCDKSMKFGI